MLCNILGKRISHLLHRRSLKSCNLGLNFSLRQVMPRLLPHRPRFNSGPVHVGFVVDNMALWQVCLWVHSALILLPAAHSYFTYLPPLRLLSIMIEIWHYILGGFKRKYKDTAYSKKGDQINYRLKKMWILQTEI